MIKKGTKIETNEKWKVHIESTKNLPEKFRTTLEAYYTGKVLKIEDNIVYFIDDTSKEEMSFHRDWVQKVN